MSSEVLKLFLLTGRLYLAFRYGLKSGFMVDVNDSDGGCDDMRAPEGLAFLRSADGIASFSVNGKQYVVTANEGDDVGLGDFDEKLDGDDIFMGSAIEFENMTALPSIFDPANPAMGTSAPFNGVCDEATSTFCSPGLAFSIGTSMVNYSDPTRPEIYQLTGIGGRGISIYEIDSSSGGSMELVWDSGSLFEVEGCMAFPWAHNAQIDEEYAPVDGEFFNFLDANDGLRTDIQEKNDPNEDGCEDGGNGMSGACPLSSTVDERSDGDGCAPETIVVGEACGELYLVTACEKNSIGFVFNIGDPSTPMLLDVIHLSPASELLNPGLAYQNRTLGEIDPESMQFLAADESPTGNAGVLFSGAFSGTASFWHFVCKETPVTAAAPTQAPNQEDPKSSATILKSTLVWLCVLLVWLRA